MMQSLTTATDADLPAAAALINAAYRGTQGWTSETDILDGLRTDVDDLRRELAEHPGAVLYLLRAAETVLGCFLLRPEREGLWYVGLLSVRPDHQDRKLGRQLLDQAEDIARRNGARRMRLTVVNVRTELIAWYQRRGYALTGETQPFPYDDALGTAKRADLAFVVLEKPL